MRFLTDGDAVIAPSHFITITISAMISTMKTSPVQLLNQRFGRLIVLSTTLISGRRWATCRCDCGSIKEVRVFALKSGKSQSCGCGAHRFDGSNRNPNGTKSIPEYSIWSGMKSRCNNPSHVHYASYGGRGIRVCDKWSNSFEAFFKDMGQRPSPHHSIERIDNASNYGPDNCCWADAKEQARNRRDNRLLTWNGQTLTVAEWSIRIGIKRSTLNMRLRSGWDASKALSTPVRFRALSSIG